MKKTWILLLLFKSLLVSSQLVFYNVNTYNFSTKQTYLIKAEKYVNRYKKKDILKLLLNRKRYILKNYYYLNGCVISKGVKLNFKKAYKLNSKVYLLDVTGQIDKNQIKAQEAVFDIKKIILKKCEIVSKNSILRRKKFIFNINRN